MNSLKPIFLVTLLAVPLVWACGSGSLSRDEAERLLGASEAFSQPITREILLGPEIRRGMGGFLNSLTGTFDFELSDCLASSQADFLAHQNGEVVLTDRGKEEQWATDPNRPNGRLIPVAEAEVVEVTGIVQDEGSSNAEVQFRWRMKWTPLMATMDFGDWAGCNPTSMLKDFRFDIESNSFKEREGRAMMRKYDDGWRLEALDIS